ncbi:hypothetical protein [Azonexus sp. R2A61]|uniref:hypothetical protein n=1 Tax=Azonexus sp. R2A61 TaxID=2744443 RepID=UPI001F2CC2C8|nr:hypothetical protein [Azonexus sp. R2A61]
MADFRETHWYVRGGPKNGGRFGYLHKGRFEIGLNHLPATKNGRVRAMRLGPARLRRIGCHG